MATIGSLSARIMADASGIKSGMGIAKQELKFARQAFIDSRTDVEKYGIALDNLKSAAKQGAFAADPTQYARAVASLKEQLDPATIAQRQLEAAVAATASKIKEHIHPGMRQYRDDISAAKQALDAGKISQLEYTEEKRRLANLLPQVQAKQEAVANALRDEAAAQAKVNAQQERVRGIVNGLNPALSEYRKGVAELNLLKQRNAITTSHAKDRMAQLTAEYRQAHPVFGEFWRLLHQHPLLTVAAGAVAAKRAFDAFAAGIQAAMQNVEQLNQQGQQLGISLPQMAQLSRAAQLGAVDTRQLADAMLELQKRGADPNLTPIQQLLTTIDQIRGLKTGTEQTTAAMQLFGEKGKELLPIIRMNEVQYAAWQATLARPMAGDAGLEKIQQANQAIKGMKIAWDDVWIVMAGSLAPEIARVADSLQSWLSQSDNLSTLQKTMENVAGAAELVMAGLELGNKALGRFNREQERLVAVVHAVIGGYFKLREAIAWGTGDSAGAKSWASMAKAEFQSLQQAIAAAEGTVRGAAPAFAGGPTGQTAAGGITPAVTPGVVTPAAVPGGAGGGKTLQQQMDWAGKTADEVTPLKLEARGLGPERLRVIAAMQQRSAAAQAAEARAEVERLNASLRDQIVTARAAAAGWSTEQIEAWKLAQRGASAEQLQQLAMLQQASAAAKAQQDAQTAAVDRQKALQGSLQETTKRLQEQIQTAGMSAEQIERWKLAQQGATPEQLAQVAALQEQAKGLQAVTKEQSTATAAASNWTAATAAASNWTAATRGSSESLDRVEAYRKMLATAGPGGGAGPVGPAVVNEGPPARRGAGPRSPAGGTPESSSQMLAKAVQLLNRIAVASERESVTVEQVG